MHAFVCKHQEDSDLLITLYDGDEMKAITENYVVKWGRQGLARDLDQFDNHRVLFTVRLIKSTKKCRINKFHFKLFNIRTGFKQSRFEQKQSLSDLLCSSNRCNGYQR